MDSNENLTLDLVAGRIDGGLADFFVWKTFLESKDGGVAAFYGQMLYGGTWGPGAGIGIRQSDTDLIEAFDKAIESARKDGTLKRLTERWFGMDMSPPSPNGAASRLLTCSRWWTSPVGQRAGHANGRPTFLRLKMVQSMISPITVVVTGQSLINHDIRHANDPGFHEVVRALEAGRRRLHELREQHLWAPRRVAS